MKIKNQKTRVQANHGITLIALVVTIVVLIILATISINAVLGENGIIAKAQNSKEWYNNGVISEEEAMNELFAKADSITGNGGDGGAGDNIDPDTGWDLTKVQKVTSEDNVVVPVPIGYTASTVTGEKSVATGFVIKEGTDGGAVEGINEFVWVPVSAINDLYDSTNNAGQLWEFSGTTSTKYTYPATQNSGYREPDVITDATSDSDSSSGDGFDARSTFLQQAGLSATATVADFKTQLQNEFTTMKNSVAKYGGFYIGRYETGNLSKDTAVVQKKNSDISNQTWYTMYKLSKTIKANNNVVSSMIWGCQWDATMRWMQTSSNPEVVNYVTDSTGKGNYCYDSDYNQIKDEVAPIATGSNSDYAINNIYDMAGNIFEWILEACSTNQRILRGGNYGYNGSSLPASSRYDGFGPSYSSKNFGSRVTLCITL